MWVGKALVVIQYQTSSDSGEDAAVAQPLAPESLTSQPPLAVPPKLDVDMMTKECVEKKNLCFKCNEWCSDHVGRRGLR